MGEVVVVLLWKRLGLQIRRESEQDLSMSGLWSRVIRTSFLSSITVIRKYNGIHASKCHVKGVCSLTKRTDKCIVTEYC